MYAVHVDAEFLPDIFDNDMTSMEPGEIKKVISIHHLFVASDLDSRLYEVEHSSRTTQDSRGVGEHSYPILHQHVQALSMPLTVSAEDHYITSSARCPAPTLQQTTVPTSQGQLTLTAGSLL